MVHKDQAKDAGIYISTLGVSPEEPRDDSGEDKAHAEDEGKVVSVLPADDLALGQIADVGDTGLTAGLDHHPSNVGPVQAFVGVVGVKVSVSVAVVGTVAAGPPFDRAFHSACAGHCKEVLEGLGGIVTAVGPKAVVARCDAWKEESAGVRNWWEKGRTEACDIVVKDGKAKGLPSELCVIRADDANERGEGKDGKAEPVYL